MGIATGTATFAWQGGEPTLMGVDFFRLVTALQMKHGHSGQVVANALQTNGTLLDDEWARFLRRYQFLVGISIDGPPEIHDKSRVNHTGGPSLELVLRGLRALQDEGVEHNVLVMLTSHSWDKAASSGTIAGSASTSCSSSHVSSRAATGDVGVLGHAGARATSCVRSSTSGGRRHHGSGHKLPCPTTSCGSSTTLWRSMRAARFSCMLKDHCGYVVIEHNGDVACDFFVDRDHCVGNILKTRSVNSSTPTCSRVLRRERTCGRTAECR